jgi:hypothetical protein
MNSGSTASDSSARRQFIETISATIETTTMVLAMRLTRVPVTTPWMSLTSPVRRDIRSPVFAVVKKRSDWRWMLRKRSLRRSNMTAWPTRVFRKFWPTPTRPASC